jgi:hypothetical protein
LRKFPKHRRPAATKHARIRIESAALPEMEFGRSRQSGRPRRSGASLRATFARVACREASGTFRCGGVRRAGPSRVMRRYRTASRLLRVEHAATNGQCAAKINPSQASPSLIESLAALARNPERINPCFWA